MKQPIATDGEGQRQRADFQARAASGQRGQARERPTLAAQDVVDQAQGGSGEHAGGSLGVRS